MATDRQESSSEVTFGQEIIQSNNHGGVENSVLPITGHKLNDQNCLQWSKSVMMFVWKQKR